MGGTGGAGGLFRAGDAGDGPAGGRAGLPYSSAGGGGPDSGGGGSSSGGGGGGGGGGATVTTDLTNIATIAGGRGGNGGDSAGIDGFVGAGGGGGAGTGIVLDGTSITNNGTITGGNGGNGGVGAGFGYTPAVDDGTGGAGGAGIAVNTTAGATITNNGTIQGGNGGNGGSVYVPRGAAGIGIHGQDLTVINSGTISAGSGSGSPDALRFTGANALTLMNPVSGLNGNIAIPVGSLTFVQDTDVTVANIVTGRGSVTKAGVGALTLTGANTYSGGTTVSGGTLIGNATSLGGPIVNNAAVVFEQVANGTFSGSISGSGSLTKTSAGTLTLSGANSYLGTTFINAGTLTVTGGHAISDASRVVIASGATLNVAQSETIGFLSGVSGAQVAIASGQTLTTQDNSGADFAGTISGAGGLNQDFAGTTTISGTSNYTGPTSVNVGTLVVNGSIASSSSLTVDAGATLRGSGQVPGTTIHGTLSPGNSPGTIRINGNLTLGAGSLYIAEVQGAFSDRVDVTGTAALAGTLRIVPLGGAYTFNSAYTLLSAAGGRSGTFGATDVAGSFGDGITSTVRYTANDVQLTLAPRALIPIVDAVAPVAPSPRFGVGRPLNAYAVAAGLDRAVADGANPSALFAIYNLPAAALPAAINQLSGEVHASAPAMAVTAADQFLRTMLDSSVLGRLAGEAGPGAAAFSGLVRKGADVPLDAPRYSVWGAGFGSFGHTDGSTRIGSAKRDLADAHLAVGADVRLMPGTVAGFAVAGGSSRASLANGLGKAEAEAFQAGLYSMTWLGAINFAAALGYARLENDVNRAIPTLGSSLTSSYATTAWSGRLQASAAMLTWNGLTLSPLAALQAIQARSPAVTETNWAGAAAGALELARRTDITSRSELGLRLDYASQLNGLPVSGYVRASWARYYQRDAGVSASIAGLPGSGFAIDGAKPSRNSALVAAGLDAKLTSSVAVGARIDGELSGTTNRLGGSAQVKVSF